VGTGGSGGSTGTGGSGGSTTQPPPPPADAGAPPADGGPAATPVPPPAGAKSLFDGKTLTGWTSVPDGNMAVVNGTLKATGKGRSYIYTKETCTHCRILFSLHPGGTGGHAPTVLIFNTITPAHDAMGGIQFQPPKGGTWDYRPGKNNAGKGLFMKVGAPGAATADGWFQCELIANSMTGEAKMACGGNDVLHFKDPTAGKVGPFAIQTHNAGISDAYKDLSIEDNITSDDYVSVKK
jgi:hypothetical protein